MNGARRTLGRWLLAAFLERGCDPTTARRPRRVLSVRALDRHELAALRLSLPRVALLSNLIPLSPARLAHRSGRA